MNAQMTRRKMLGVLASAPLLAGAPALFGGESAPRKRMGVCTYSYNIHWSASREGHLKAQFKDPIEFLDYCHELGAGGVQMGLGPGGSETALKLRAKAETLAMYFEGQVSLPKDESDVVRFDSEIRATKEAGAEIVRVAMLSGRRYETFDSAEAFRQFAEKSWKALTLAEPIVRKHRLKMAIENHKDLRVSEQVDVLKRLGSEFVGVNVDTGNNIALLEDPMTTVDALAPFAFTTHLKDMAVQEYEDGFLLSEVPLGDGFLDLNRIVERLRKANSKIQFNLEMITRDPLKIPCLTQKYWATMTGVPASHLAGALAMVLQHSSKKYLPRTTGLDTAEQLEMEDGHVRKSFAYAREHLGM
jgi:sugar phosphate isomerase/epimerase